MTYPKVKITSGVHIDAHNYALTFHEAIDSFFQPKEYYILPYIPKHKNIAGKTIFLPDLPMDVDRRSEEQLEKVLKFPKINLEEREGYINGIFPNLWKDILNIFGDDSFKSLESIEFQITNVGSGGRTLISDDLKRIVVVSRKDILPELMFSTLIMGLVKYNGYTEEYTWEERMAIRTWVERSTRLKRYFQKKYLPMLANLRLKQQQGKYQLESREYLKKLGLNHDIEIGKEGNITLNGTILQLSEHEQSLVKVLNENRGGVVDYDTIFNTVWGSNLDEFSLYSISKLVERTRKKLANVGITKDLITSVKGKGYCIK